MYQMFFFFLLQDNRIDTQFYFESVFLIHVPTNGNE